MGMPSSEHFAAKALRMWHAAHRLWLLLVVVGLGAGRAASKPPLQHESRTERVLSHGGCHITPTAYNGKILVAGATNIKPSAEDCRNSCG